MEHPYQEGQLHIWSTIEGDTQSQTPTSAQIGRTAELIFEQKMVKWNTTVSKPSDPGSCSYDYIVDHDGQLHRVQVKAIRKRNNGKRELKLRSTHRQSGDHVYTPDDADWVCGVDLETEQLFWVSTAEIQGRTSITF